MFSLYMCLWVTRTWCPQSPKSDLRSPRTGVRWQWVSCRVGAGSQCSEPLRPLSSHSHCLLLPPSSHFFRVPYVSESMLIMHCIFKCVFHIFFKSMWYLPFQVWLISLTMMVSKCIHFSTNDISFGEGVVLFCHVDFLFVWDKVSCSPGCPWTGLVAEDGSGLLVLLSPTSLVLGPHTCTTTPSLCRAGGSRRWGCSQLVACLPSMQGALALIANIW